MSYHFMVESDLSSSPSRQPVSTFNNFWWTLRLCNRPIDRTHGGKQELVARVSADADWSTLCATVSGGFIQVENIVTLSVLPTFYIGAVILDAGTWRAMNAALRAAVVNAPPDPHVPVIIGTLLAFSKEPLEPEMLRAEHPSDAVAVCFTPSTSAR
ncbi:hypothetical protein FA95DRAFT_1607696 [Auriscalpium vulgare]|uniref:Uncharacterized protein n=1 Tax=Auriscalpium vulgare TaxID=40419 RepID=A0ACB8RNT4_9AGAM|nr:hypothetical protein FA95DRAFT_1607696 [Auriscalpium vulgare]